MNDLLVKGNWNQLKGQLKREFAELTDDDLTYTEGHEQELVGKLQEKLGKSKEDIRDILERLQN